jgi:Flp pilus assembly protein TadD
VVTLKPDVAEAHSNRGAALMDRKRPTEALASYDKAIALKPDYAEAYNNRGAALMNLWQASTRRSRSSQTSPRRTGIAALR